MPPLTDTLIDENHCWTSFIVACNNDDNSGACFWYAMHIVLDEVAIPMRGKWRGKWLADAIGWASRP